MSSRYPPLPASSSPTPSRGRTSNPRTSGMSPVTEPTFYTPPRNTPPRIYTPPRIVRTNMPFSSLTMGANNAITSRLQLNPVIGTERWILRTPTPPPSYSGMDLSAVPSRSPSPSAPPRYSGVNLSAVYSRPTTATRPVAVDRDKELQKIFEAALESNDERNKAERDANRESKNQARRILKNEYARGKMERTPYVDERQAYRQHILSHSLFPNLYNQQMVMTQLGAS